MRFLQLSLVIFVGGMMVLNPSNKKQVFTAACITVGIDKFIGGLVDVAKVFIGLAELEPVKGLPESVLIIQDFEFLNHFVLAGIIFGAIPAMYLVPKLYRNIEPLLGMKPREERTAVDLSKILNVKVILVGLVLSLVSAGAAFLDEMDMNLIEWELEFENLLGGNYIYLAIVIGTIALFLIVRYYTKKPKNKETNEVTA